MAGIPPNMIPANTSDLANNLVTGVTTDAQQVVADVVTNAVGGVAGNAQATIAQAQANAVEQLNSLAVQLQLPPDALVALNILNTIFSYEELSTLSIEDIKNRINAIKLTFKLSRPQLPEIPKLEVPSLIPTLDSVIPDIFPNDSGLDAYGEQILDRIKQLRQAAQSKFETEAAERARNMFQLRQDLVQEESQRLIRGLTENLPV